MHTPLWQPPEWHESLASTNSWLLDAYKANPDLPHGTVVAAYTQTAGRGRQQRSWQAVPNKNLTFSFLWSAPVPRTHIPAMAQSLSVGIVDFLDREGVSARIKWPNDILVSEKKIGGILCEAAGRKHFGIVAGIGLNINMDEEEAQEIDQPATSLRIETGTDRVVTEVLPDLLGALSPPLQAWASGGFPAIRADYTRYAAAIGSAVRVRDGTTHIAGTLAGYEDSGALRLLLSDGNERVLYSGDIVG